MFGSSAVNKSGKKIVPRVPVRRRGGNAANKTGAQASADGERSAGSTPGVSAAKELALQDLSVERNDGRASVEVQVPTRREITTSIASQQPAGATGDEEAASGSERTEDAQETAAAGNDSRSRTPRSVQEHRDDSQKEKQILSSDPKLRSRPSSKSRGQSQERSRTRTAEATQVTDVRQLPTPESTAQTTGTPSETQAPSAEATVGEQGATSAPTTTRNKSGRKTETAKKRKRTTDADTAGSQDAEAQAQPATKRPRKVRKDKGTTRAPKTPAIVPQDSAEEDIQEEAPTSEAGSTRARTKKASSKVTGSRVTKPKRKNSRKSSTTPATERSLQDPDVEGDEDAVDGTEHPKRRGRRKREDRSETPEDAQYIEVDEEAVALGELTRDLRQGKISKLGQRMKKIKWDEVERQNQIAKRTAPEVRPRTRETTQVRQSPERAGEGEDDGGEGDEALADDDAPPRAYHGPRMKMVNGQMIIDETSLTVSNDRYQDIDLNNMDVVEDDELTAQLNSHSFVFNTRRDPNDRRLTPNTRWSDDDDTKFFIALGMFGTDFSMVASMFPDRTRVNIKHKFTREERQNPVLVNAALVGQVKTRMDIQKYLNESGIAESQLVDPAALAAELAAATAEKQPEIDAAKAEYLETERQRRIAQGDDSGKENSGKKKRRKKNQMAAGENEVVINSIEGAEFEMEFGV